MPYFNVQTVQIIVLALVAVAVLLQVILVIAIFVGVTKMGKTIKEEVEEMHSSVMPIVYNARELMANVTPKIETTVDDLAVVVHAMRTQSKEVETDHPSGHDDVGAAGHSGQDRRRGGRRGQSAREADFGAAGIGQGGRRIAARLRHPFAAYAASSADPRRPGFVCVRAMVPREARLRFNSI